jgi:hypothetical protein
MPDHRLFTDFHPRHDRRPRSVVPLNERIEADFRRELARLDALLGRRPDTPRDGRSTR